MMMLLIGALVVWVFWMSWQWLRNPDKPGIFRKNKDKKE